MADPISEVRTTRYCIHPYFGFVCLPNTVLDFADTISTPLGHPATAHIDAWGFRNHARPSIKPPGETWLGIFGGSVAFGVASSGNDSTIAGYLEADLNTHAPGRHFRVLNFALPAGQQPQALMIFAQHAGILDGVITFDGVNEGVIPAYYNRDAVPAHFPYRPFYEVLFARSLTDEQRVLQRMIEDEEHDDGVARGWLRSWSASRRQRRVKRLKDELSALSPTTVLQSIFPTLDVDSAAYVNAGVQNWRECTRTMHALATSKRVDFLSVIQPVPERGKRLTAREQTHIEPYPEVLKIRSDAYQALSRYRPELIAEGVDCLDFADVFGDRVDDMYVDLIHLADRACEIVAGRIANHLRNRWASVIG